jgi:hypothetical protein
MSILPLKYSGQNVGSNIKYLVNNLDFDFGEIKFIEKVANLKGNVILPKRLFDRNVTNISEAQKTHLNWAKDKKIISSEKIQNKYDDLQLTKWFGTITADNKPLDNINASYTGNLWSLIIEIDDKTDESSEQADLSELKQDLSQIRRVISGKSSNSKSKSKKNKFCYLNDAITDINLHLSKRGDSSHFKSSLGKYIMSPILERKSVDLKSLSLQSFQKMRRQTIAIKPFIEYFILINQLNVDRESPVFKCLVNMTIDNIALLNDIISFCKEREEPGVMHKNIIGVLYNSFDKDLQKSFEVAIDLINNNTLNFVQCSNLLKGMKHYEQLYCILSAMTYDTVFWHLNETTRYTSKMSNYDFKIYS